MLALGLTGMVAGLALEVRGMVVCYSTVRSRGGSDSYISLIVSFRA